MPYRLKITEDEVRAELAQMGYTNIPDEMVESFRKDLLKMIKSDLRKLKKDKERLRDTDDSVDRDATPSAKEKPYSQSQMRRTIPETSTPLSPEQKLSRSHRVTIEEGGYESGYSDRDGTTSNSSEVSYEGKNVTSDFCSMSDISERNRQPQASKGGFPRDSQSQEGKRPSTTRKTVVNSEAKAVKTGLDTVGERAALTASVRPKASSSGWKKKDGQADIKNIKTSKPKKTLPSYPSRNDPVALYHFYRAHWDKYKTPGEDPRSKLRWEVRTKLFYSS